jgi:hypothetical protein
LSTRIEIPEANLQNISIFSMEPSDELIEEIKQHVRLTSSPHTWRGHSHTKPDKGAFVVYVEEFDVPAPDSVLRVAPCPCCNPYHPQYKNKGKIAWFPHESVIRLIGPQCFAAINAGGHDAAIIDLRKRQKRRDELATIALHAPSVDGLIAAIDEALPIADDLDNFMREINRVVDNELRLQLWREVKDGNLTTSETRRVPIQKADGTSGERMEEFRVPFAQIAGHAMIDRSGQTSANKLKPIRSGLAAFAARLEEVGAPDALGDAEREKIADAFPKGRAAVTELLAGMADRQSFLTSGAVEALRRWGQHQNAPIRFSIERKKSEVILSAPDRSRMAPAVHSVPIGDSATKPIPEVPEIRTK